MRLGATRFVGRAGVVEHLAGRGHAVLVVHRGRCSGTRAEATIASIAGARPGYTDAAEIGQAVTEALTLC